MKKGRRSRQSAVGRREKEEGSRQSAVGRREKRRWAAEIWSGKQGEGSRKKGGLRYQLSVVGDFSF